MYKKIIQFLITAILVLMPFFPILENFFPTVSHDNFFDYLIACLMIAFLMTGLVFLLNFTTETHPRNLPPLHLPGWLLFVLGILVMAPLHMGPPKHGEELLVFIGLEQFRYAMLLLAITVYTIAVWLALKTFEKNGNLFEKASFVPVILAAIISFWDYFDALQMGDSLQHWVAAGKKTEDFFPNYNFHENWRTAGRMLLYVTAGWLAIIVRKQEAISKLSVVLIVLFCVAGLGFCTACLVYGHAYYFPFMVPAVALAPAYWISIALFNKTGIAFKPVSR